MTTPDPALETALDVLDGLVCECGHVEAEHAMHILEDNGTAICDDGCPCQVFRPVDFFVQRASVPSV